MKKENLRTKSVAISTLQLLQRARAAAANAYAPYSQFAVGAAVETRDGRVFTGANMENASYGLTLCAEAGALQAASSAGALSMVKQIAIVGGPIRRQLGKAMRPIAPCGRCRQLIQEAAMLSGRDIRVLSANLSLTRRSISWISKLLPGSFGASDLPVLDKWPRLSRLLRRRVRHLT